MGQWVLLVYTMNEDMRLLLLWENATLTRGVPGSIGCADVFHETDSAFSEKHPELTTKLRVFQNVLRACSYGWEKLKQPWSSITSWLQEKAKRASSQGFPSNK